MTENLNDNWSQCINHKVEDSGIDPHANLTLSSHPLHAPPDIGQPPGDHSQLHHELESFLSTTTHKRQWDGREEVNISLH